MKKECVAMLLAGGQGSRLHALTSHVAKPAVPFGGKYRIIDFPLSNCTNSGIDTVGVLTQYKPMELHAYIGNGAPWDLDRQEGGVHILPPYQSENEAGSWYKGTANAIYQNLSFMEMYNPEYVLILSGDHIYKMDYAKMLRHHKEVGAACTISVLEVSREEASRFGIMNVDENDLVYEFEEKPANPKSNLASMGIYIFTWSKLREYLIADEDTPESENDFGKNIIPAMLGNNEILTAYRFSGYWKDVGTIDSLWDANMDMLAINSGISLYDQSWSIYSRTPTKPPHFVSKEAALDHVILTGGCEVHGSLHNSVLFHSVTVEPGANVKYSILMPGVTVKAGATVDYAIVAENAVIGANAKVGSPPTGKEDWGVAVIAEGITVGDGATVSAAAMLTSDVGEGEMV